MPYCAQCGKTITQDMLMRNNGECDECYQKANITNSDVRRPESQSTSTNLTNCAYCYELTNVYCEKCKKPLCQKHITIFGHISNGKILCDKCHSDESSWCFPWCCLCGIVIIPLLFVLMLLS